MRLAFVTTGDTSRKTGGHRYNARLMHGLRGRGVEVEEVLASHGAGGRFSPGRFDAISVDALACAVCAPYLDSWRKRVPVVAMVHELPSVADPGGTGDTSDTEARALSLEEPLLRADRLVCVSRHGASILSGRGVSAGRVHVVPPGLDRPEVSAPDESAGGPTRVLCVAQWIPRKGIVDLVEAWKALEERYTGHDAVLELIGETDADPAYSARVRDSIDSIACTRSIIVRGPVSESELHESYAAADLFALPSTYEGYGMVYAEALSYALPVVALCAGPVPNLVGDAGLLSEPGDTPGLTDALSALICDAPLRRRLSRAAHRRAGELPGWEDAVSGFLEAIRAAVAERSVGR